MRIHDVCIIGGGPAGLMAAVRLAEAGKDCILLEKMEKTGRKLRITGKGRCNLTNVRGDMDGYIVHGREFTSIARERFTPKDTVDWFTSLGVTLTTERGGRVFPESGKAWDIAQAMVDRARSAGVSVKSDSKVVSAVKDNDGCFTIGTEDGTEYRSRNVIIATGGASYPSTGSTGDGYRFAWKLGHTIVSLRPSLTHLEVKGKPEEILLRNVKVSVTVDGRTVSEEFGEAEFSDRGLAGAAVLPQSINAVDAFLDNHKVQVILDLKPALDRETITGRCRRENTGSCRDLIRKFVPWQLAGRIAGECKVKLNDPFPENGYGRLADILKGLRFDVTGYGDFDYAIVTAGGVSTEEIDPSTMESKICRGLYFAGEVMDIDARTGGYNIQLALSTAVLAADSIIAG